MTNGDKVHIISKSTLVSVGLVLPIVMTILGMYFTTYVSKNGLESKELIMQTVHDNYITKELYEKDMAVLYEIRKDISETKKEVMEMKVEIIGLKADLSNTH